MFCKTNSNMEILSFFCSFETNKHTHVENYSSSMSKFILLGFPLYLGNSDPLFQFFLGHIFWHSLEICALFVLWGATINCKLQCTSCLANFSFLEIWFITSTVPNMLANFLHIQDHFLLWLLSAVLLLLLHVPLRPSSCLPCLWQVPCHLQAPSLPHCHASATLHQNGSLLLGVRLLVLPLAYISNLSALFVVSIKLITSYVTQDPLIKLSVHQLLLRSSVPSIPSPHFLHSFSLPNSTPWWSELCLGFPQQKAGIRFSLHVAPICL